MSLNTMTSGRSCAAAMLFSASHAMPPVSAPSPITATTLRRSASPRRCERLRDAVGVRQGRRGVAVLDDVVRALGPAAGSRTARPPAAACRTGRPAQSGSCAHRSGDRCRTRSRPAGSRTPGAGRWSARRRPGSGRDARRCCVTLRDQELADLGGELAGPARRGARQVLGRADPGQRRHDHECRRPAARSEQRAQDVLQDAAVAVVVGLTRGVDPHAPRRTRSRPRSSFTASTASSRGVTPSFRAVAPVIVNDSVSRRARGRRRSGRRGTAAAARPCRSGSSGGCARSDSAMTALTPSSAVPLAAQSREEPEPYSLPARMTSGHAGRLVGGSRRRR